MGGACADLLQELSQLSSFGVSGAQALFGGHHGADAPPVCVLSRAVDLPSLLWSDRLHNNTNTTLTTQMWRCAVRPLPPKLRPHD